MTTNEEHEQIRAAVAAHFEQNPPPELTQGILPDYQACAAIRRWANMTQAVAAEILGVSQSALAMWETGARNPKSAAADRWLTLLTLLNQGG